MGRLTDRRNVIDILDKMSFFQGQRAGRELWNDKPRNVQEKDLDNFNRDIRTIRDYIFSLENELKSYRDLEEQGLLLRLDSKDKLIEVLASKLLETEFGYCYMCTNPMKNVTLDGIHNGCDGHCNVSEKFTVDDFLKKIVREMQRKPEAEEALKKMREGSE